MTRRYLLRAPDGRTVTAAFAIPRVRRPGWSADYRRTCAGVLAFWHSVGFTVVRRLPPRRITRSGSAAMAWIPESAWPIS